jgi:hypothetical protein
MDNSLTLNELMGEGMDFSAINVGTGDTTLVAAQSGKVIRVHYVYLKCAADAVVRFESEAGGTALTGQMQMRSVNNGLVGRAADGEINMPFCPPGLFWTNAGELLNIEVSGADVDGVIGYSVRAA